MKLEKEIKPERREKTRKYINAQKQLKTRQIRKEDSHNMAIKVMPIFQTLISILIFAGTS